MSHPFRLEQLRGALDALPSGAVACLSRNGVSHTVPLPQGARRFDGRATHAVDVSPFRNILAIDPEARRCIAEPGVTFGELVAALRPHGLAPQVVPEFQGITLGGAVAGCSLESTSHRVGGFHDTCVEYELLTSRGEVVTCSRGTDPFLFGMVQGSFGTLGILTRLVFALAPAKPCVRLEFRRWSRVEPFFEAMLEACEQGEYPFIDAIAHASDRFVLCLGRFEEGEPAPASSHALPYYRLTERRASDALAAERYFFRYDADCHWMSRAFPPLEWALVRRWLGPWLLGADRLIRWSRRVAPFVGRFDRPRIVVDAFLPRGRFLEFFAWYGRELGHFPLWLIPYRMPEPYPWTTALQQERLRIDELLIDVGIYGAPDTRDHRASKQLEEALFQLGGIKALIGRNHYSEERFWTIYDRPNHLKAKARLDPRGLFPTLYEKVH